MDYGIRGCCHVREWGTSDSMYLLYTQESEFVLFNDIWSQQGHSVLCMAILFSLIAMTRSNIKPHNKMPVSLVIVDGHVNLP